MVLSIQFGQKEVTKFLIEKGANDWNMGIQAALSTRNPDMSLVTFFMKKGATKNGSLKGASMGGHVKLVQFFYENGAQNVSGLNSALVAASLEYNRYDGEPVDDPNMKKKLMEVIDYLISVGASPDYGLLISVKHLNYELINYFLKKGAKAFQAAEAQALEVGNERLANFFKNMFHM